jgi:hypothetical protein
MLKVRPAIPSRLLINGWVERSSREGAASDDARGGHAPGRRGGAGRAVPEPTSSGLQSFLPCQVSERTGQVDGSLSKI